MQKGLLEALETATLLTGTSDQFLSTYSKGEAYKYL